MRRRVRLGRDQSLPAPLGRYMLRWILVAGLIVVVVVVTAWLAIRALDDPANPCRYDAPCTTTTVPTTAPGPGR